MSIHNGVREFIAAEYLPGTDPAELGDDYDLLDTGVIDSLGLLRLIEWVAQRYDIAIDQLDLSPEHFRSVAAVAAFIDSAGAARVQ